MKGETIGDEGRELLGGEISGRPVYIMAQTQGKKDRGKEGAEGRKRERERKPQMGFSGFS